MPPDPPSGPTKFFSPPRGTQNFLGTPLKPVKFWAGSAPEEPGTSPLERKGSGPTPEVPEGNVAVRSDQPESKEPQQSND